MLCLTFWLMVIIISVACNANNETIECAPILVQFGVTTFAAKLSAVDVVCMFNRFVHHNGFNFIFVVIFKYCSLNLLRLFSCYFLHAAMQLLVSCCLACERRMPTGNGENRDTKFA